MKVGNFIPVDGNVSLQGHEIPFYFSSIMEKLGPFFHQFLSLSLITNIMGKMRVKVFWVQIR